MTSMLTESHARTLIAVIDQSANWKLHPEKKPLFASADSALDYLAEHNEPLYIRVPVSDGDDYLEVKVSSSGSDMVFSAPKLHDTAEARVHHSHLKLIPSAVSDLLNSALPEGKKSAPF